MTTTTVEIPTSLLEQQASLNASLATIAEEQAKLATQKSEVEASLARLDRAIRFLRGEEIPVMRPAGSNGPRKPMSEEAKQKIREAMLRRSAAAKAAVPAPSAPEAAPAPVPVPDTTTKTASAKSGKKAGK